MTDIIAAGLMAVMGTMAAYGVACDVKRTRRHKASPPVLGRYTTTLELYGIAVGALEPLGTIDQEMAARIIRGDVRV